MNDYDADLAELLNEMTLPAGGLALIRRIYSAGYKRGKSETPKGLPGVTAEQVRERLGSLGKDAFESGTSLVEAMADWFNDPNRDAPVNPTMHPDLEWLAQLPPERFNVPTTPGDSREPYFFKRTERCTHRGAAWVKTSTVGWGSCVGPRPPLTWTLSDIEQARRHLARQDEDELRPWYTLDEAKDVLHKRSKLHPDNDPELDVYVLGLNNLPDYETWFEVHGSERTVKYRPQDTREATVHELYTHFRARLLDELRQAGVIGDER